MTRFTMTDDSAFSFRDVTKRYGDKLALDGLTLAVPRGSVVGLVGRNGAGKSTAIRCLVGLHRPSTGEVRLLGHDPATMPAAEKQRLGYMSEQGGAFPAATAQDLIDFCAPLYPRWDSRLADEIFQRFAIDPGRKLGKLSLGQQRTVALLLAICPRPEVLVLDEPAANLDPAMRREFLDQVLALLGDGGHTVLFSTHLLADVERVADRVALLHEGRLRLDRNLDELRADVRRLRLVFPGEAPAAIDGVPGILRTRRAGRELLLTVESFDEQLPARLAHQTGAQVEAHPLGLEDLFIDLVGDTRAVAA